MPERKTNESASNPREEVQLAIAWLKRNSTERDRRNLARFGIVAKNALGVSLANIQALAKQLGRNHEVAAALWDTGCYEARLLCSFIDEPACVTPAQMDRWCHDFDNWAICDTICFHLFDRTPYAWAKVIEWSDRDDEFVKRAAFALLASLAGHDKKAGDRSFIDTLSLIERAATDERNFVKKGVSWALRRVGRRNAVLYAATMPLIRRLAESHVAASRWVGRDAMKDLTRPAVAEKLATRKATKASKGQRT